MNIQPIVRWKPLVEAAIAKLGYADLRVDLILAIIAQESSGDPWAIRYEDNYQYFYHWKEKKPLYDSKQSAHGNRIRAKGLLGDTEFNAQSTSWGLLQLMAAAGRERGFKGKYLSELLDPPVNLHFGLIHLWEWGYQRGSRTTEQALIRWNGDPAYAAKVLAKLNEVEAAK